jgi:hypothetical protein
MTNQAAPAPQPSETGVYRAWIGSLIAIALAGALYAPMLKAAYVWDDSIYQQQQLPYFHGVRDAFFPPVNKLYGFVSFYYRPLIPLSSMLDQYLSGHPGGEIPPAWSHGANVVYHMAVTGLVYLLAFAILQGAPPPPGARWPQPPPPRSLLFIRSTPR